MIQLREDQLPPLDAPEQPPVAVDPRTGQGYLLIRRDIYEKVQALLQPLGRAWNNPADDDLIREGDRVGCGGHVSSSKKRSCSSAAARCLVSAVGFFSRNLHAWMPVRGNPSLPTLRPVNRHMVFFASP